MTALELDRVYTQLCNTLTDIGSTRATQYLARFALLALSRELPFDRAQCLIDDAARGLEMTPPQDSKSDEGSVVN